MSAVVMPPDRAHFPAVTPGRREGEWLVYCVGCSHEAGDWVERCRRNPAQWPPTALAAVRKNP